MTKHVKVIPEECAYCGEMKTDCDFDERYWLTCSACRGEAEDADPRADRGDWQCHQMRDA